MMEKKKIRAALGLVLLAAVPACIVEAGNEASVDELGAAQQEVLNGTATLKHPEIVKLSIGTTPWCSGVLITTSYFLTAAHCTDDGINTVTAESADGNIKLTSAINWLVPLTHVPTLPSVADLALGELLSPVPANWPMARIVTAPGNGSQATIIGYGGNVSSDCTAGASGAGTKRFRTGNLGSMPWACGGDSGGGWIKGGIDSAADVFGISSGSTGIITRASGYTNPITGFMRGEDGGFEFGIDRVGSDLRTILTANRSVCRLECEKDPACMAFTQDGTQNRCHLKSATPAPSPSNAGVVIVSGLATGMGSFDVPGNNLRSFTRASADLCRVDCARDAQCLAYTWVTQSQTCFLKNARPAAVSCPAGITCTSGYRRTQAPPPPPPPPGPAFAQHWESNLDYGTDRPGGDLPNMPIQTSAVAGCADACDQNAQCKTWTFLSHAVSPGNPLCYLKSSDRAPVVDPATTRGIISGQKGRRHF